MRLTDATTMETDRERERERERERGREREGEGGRGSMREKISLGRLDLTSSRGGNAQRGMKSAEKFIKKFTFGSSTSDIFRIDVETSV